MHSQQPKNSGNLYPESIIYFPLPSWSSNNSVELLFSNNTAVEYHIPGTTRSTLLPLVIEYRHTHNLNCISYSRTTAVISSVFVSWERSPLLSSVQQYNSTDTSWPSYLEQVPDLYSDALTNVIGTSIHERVYAWVHIVRDYGILYNSRLFVVPIPLLSVDPLAIAIILVTYPCLPALSQLLPTNRPYTAQICDNIGTPPSPFFIFFNFVVRIGSTMPKFCQIFATCSHFFQLCDSNMVLLVKFTPLVSFLLTFAALPTEQGYMLQNTFKSCGFLLLDKIIAVSPA